MPDSLTVDCGWGKIIYLAPTTVHDGWGKLRVNVVVTVVGWLTLPWDIAVNNFVHVACATFNSIVLIRFPMIVYVYLYVYVYDRLHTASLGRIVRRRRSGATWGTRICIIYV